MYRFISVNATKENLLGEYRTLSEKRQICFSVSDSSGGSWELVLGAPPQLYTSRGEGSSGNRSTRLIITAYFRSSAVTSFLDTLLYGCLPLCVLLGVGILVTKAYQ